MFKKKLNLGSREMPYILLTLEGVEQYCKVKLKRNKEKVPRVLARINEIFDELDSPYTIREYICDEPWIIRQCAAQLVDEAGLPLLNPTPDIRNCICPNLANVITNPYTCKSGIVEELAITWMSETYPFMRADNRNESRLRDKYIHAGKYLLQAIMTDLKNTTGLTGPITANDLSIRRARDYLRNNIRPDPLTWQSFLNGEIKKSGVVKVYKLQNWGLIDRPDHTRALKFVYVKGRNDVIDITVLRI